MTGISKARALILCWRSSSRCSRRAAACKHRCSRFQHVDAHARAAVMSRRSSTATLGVALSVAGMGALCAGFKLSALSLFGAGIKLLEKDWRARHPEFVGNAAERWQASLSFYRDTHQNGTNRTLHLIGIPLIVGGAAGLFASKPFSPVTGVLWAGSLGAFAAGWALNLV